MGPPLPGERDSTSAPTVAGVTPTGDALAVPSADGDQLTLHGLPVVGLRDVCRASGRPSAARSSSGLPDGVRLVVVTKGPELEIAGGGPRPGARGCR